MKIDGVPYRTIWLNDDGWSVEIIDQTVLAAPVPHSDAEDAGSGGDRDPRHAGARGHR